MSALSRSGPRRSPCQPSNTACLISRDAHEVFAFVTQASNLPVWDSATIHAVQLDDGPPKLGTRTRGTSKLLGRRVDWTTEVTVFDEDHQATWTTIEGPFRFAASTRLQTIGTRTRLTYRVEGESGLGGFFGRLADPLVASTLSRTVKANLGNLCELLDSGAKV